MMYYIPPLLLLLTLFANTLAAQHNPVTVSGNHVNLRVGGTIQPRITWSSENDALFNEKERLGFGVRRARLRFYVSLKDNMRIFLQAEGAGNSVQLLDIRGELDWNRNLTFRIGRMAGAQPRGMAITLHSDIDAIDRTVIADFWAKNTIGADARDYGLETLLKLEEFEFRLFIHNGWNGANFRNGPADASLTGSSPGTAQAIHALIRYRPESNKHADFGGHFGYNASKNINTTAFSRGRKLMDFSLHAYYGAFAGDQPLRLKFDFIGIHFESIQVPLVGRQNYQQTALGASLFGGFLLRNDTEVFGRIECIEPDTEARNRRENYYTSGISYSFSAANGRSFMEQKVTGAYTHKRFGDPAITKPSHIGTIQWQFYF